MAPAVDTVVDPVVILGGGLTGISTALHLRAPWLLVEGGAPRRPRAHRRARRLPLRQDRALAAPARSLHQAARRRAVARADGAGRAQGPNFSHGVLTRYPFQANLYGLPPEVVKECLLGFVEAQLAHGAQAGAERPRTSRSSASRTSAPGIAQHFMIPYNQKLWGVHPREITAAWCSRFVPLPKLEDVIAGAVGRGPPELGYNRRFLYPQPAASRPSRARCSAAWPRGRGAHRRRARRGRLAPARGDRRRRARPVPRARRHHAAARAAEAHDGRRPRSRRRPRAAALHAPALPRRGARGAAAGGLPLGLRARGEVSVLPRGHATRTPCRAWRRPAWLALRRAGRPRPDHRRGRARHRGGAGRGWRASAAPTTSCSPSRARSSTRTSCSTTHYYAAHARRSSVPRGARHLPARPLRRVDLHSMEDCLLVGREVAALLDRDVERARESGQREQPERSPHALASSSPSTTRRRSCTRRCSICGEKLRAARLELRDPPRRERLARPHRRDRRASSQAEYPRGAHPSRWASPTTAALRRASCARAAQFVICDEIDLRHRLLPARAGAARARRGRHGDRLEGSWPARTTSGRCCATPRRRLQRHAARAVGFRGTDTHGLKAFRRDALLDDRASAAWSTRTSSRASS